MNMVRATKILSIIQSTLGLTLWAVTATWVRHNLRLLEREVVVSPLFSVLLVILLGVAMLSIMTGLSHTMRAATAYQTLSLVELVLAIGLNLLLIFVVTKFRIVGDIGPQSPVPEGESLPLVIALLMSPWLYRAITAAIVITTFSAFYVVLRRRH